MTCAVDGCPKPARCRGWCDTHYKRWRRSGTTDKPTAECEVEGCTRTHYGRGWCQHHYNQHRDRTWHVSCGLCGARLGTIPPGGTPWAAIDNHHCEEKRTA